MTFVARIRVWKRSLTSGPFLLIISHMYIALGLDPAVAIHSNQEQRNVGIERDFMRNKKTKVVDFDVVEQQSTVLFSDEVRDVLYSF